MRRISDERGQSLVEFAVCAVLLVMMLFGVVEFGRIALVYTTVSNGARIGVRYAMVHGSDDPVATSAVQGIVRSYLQAGLMNASNTSITTINVCYPDNAGAGAGSCPSACTDPGCHVTVQVSYQYDPLVTYFPLNITLSSQSQGVITF